MKRLFGWRILCSATLVSLVFLYALVSIFVVRGVAIIDRSESDVNGPAYYNLPAKDVEFPSRNSGVNLRGWHIASPEKNHTIIFVHGFGGNRASASALDIGAGLWKNGFNVLLFDLRASGISQGDMASGGYFEQDDLLGAFDFVRNTGVPSGNVGVIGFSMGAATAILGASKEPGIKAVVSDGTYTSISDLIEQEVALATPMPAWIVPFFSPGISIMADFLYDIKIAEVVPETGVSDIRYPILLIHGTDDTRVPLEHSIRVHKTAPPGSILWQVQGAGHVGSFNQKPNEYMTRIVGYFNTRFGL